MKKVFFLLFFLVVLAPSVYVIKHLCSKKGNAIVQISQLSLQKEALSSLYLTELLDLSYNKKVYREDFDLEIARKKLISSPLIEKASLCFLKSGHLQVSYRHVTPFAVLADFNNAAIDCFGKIFPIKPFLSPKGLVKVFLGIENLQNSFQINDYKEIVRWNFALKLLKKIYNLQINGDILALDVSKIEEKSLGKNEVILTIEYPKRKDILRLTKRNYLNELSHYIILCDKLDSELGVCMVDLRHGDQALIENF